MLSTRLQERNAEATELRAIKSEQQSLLTQNAEEIHALQRELNAKAARIRDVEARCTAAVSEADQLRFKVQELQKTNTEQKLRLDVRKSEVEGLRAEIGHQGLELKETRGQLHIYEEKCEALIQQTTEATAELNSLKRQMISHTQSTEEKEAKIKQLKTDLTEATLRAEALELELSTLKIHHAKAQEQLGSLNKTYEETVEKLHKMNRARHDLETKLSDEIERNRALQDIVRLKEENILKRQVELEELDRKVVELERALEQLEIKKQAGERAAELQKKQLQD